MEKIKKSFPETGENLAIVAVLVFWLHLLLKLNAVVSLLLGAFLLWAIGAHRKRQKLQQEEWQSLEEVFTYLELMIYAFAGEEKIEDALREVLAGLSAGRMKNEIRQSLHYLESAYDEPAFMEGALLKIEAAYPCSRIHTLHQLLLQIEFMGGSSKEALDLLLEDKKRWEIRMRLDRKERKAAFRQILLSEAASLLICSLVCYMPVNGMDVSKNPFSQALTLMVLLLDDAILLIAQKGLLCHWRGTPEEEESKKKGKQRERTIEDFRGRQEAKEKKRSLLWGSLSLLLLAFFLLRKRYWAAALTMGLSMICFRQDRIGRFLARKRLTEQIRLAFPVWMLQIALLLQGDNVPVAVERSFPEAPKILKTELIRFQNQLEAEPESPLPYHRFLEDFDLYEVRFAMNCLYAIATGSTKSSGKQFQQLIEVNLQLQDQEESRAMKENSSSMYLLFLLPVVTASAKLLADMTIFLLSFAAISI